MGKGNKPMRVAPEFSKIVRDMTNSLNQTSAEVTKIIAVMLKKKR